MKKPQKEHPAVRALAAELTADKPGTLGNPAPIKRTKGRKR